MLITLQKKEYHLKPIKELIYNFLALSCFSNSSIFLTSTGLKNKNLYTTLNFK